ncbi:avidin/streptavidin family protein [Flavitalea sp. BT771]|uniref:avidin/streptavidin family protein n=1 Tax=Flavitalea sp. BT771 TaxID=3063329 RepID=UPI0026E1A6D7|nr:avidin/streptavidin family protein [Flavitalea sp. BT771]MDO6435444.1 avidin/streptavidin family protein [Flavitalea sp. BT771]MDV6224196.1 avidin/streptavidin family protein [Flavitalea sp. BT771]
MSWLGKWRNQYGSIIEITCESNHKIAGKFRTALKDSAFYGQEVDVSGMCQGDCIGISGGSMTPAGNMLVTYTGLLRDGKLETLWYVVTDSAIHPGAEGELPQKTKLSWWQAMSTGADTFEQIDK